MRVRVAASPTKAVGPVGLDLEVAAKPIGVLPTLAVTTVSPGFTTHRESADWGEHRGVDVKKICVLAICARLSRSVLSCFIITYDISFTVPSSVWGTRRLGDRFRPILRIFADKLVLPVCADHYTEFNAHYSITLCCFASSEGHAE